jgi:hypothetical protein
MAFAGMVKTASGFDTKMILFFSKTTKKGEI